VQMELLVRCMHLSWETPLIQLARAWFCLLNTWGA